MAPETVMVRPEATVQFCKKPEPSITGEPRVKSCVAAVMSMPVPLMPSRFKLPFDAPMAMARLVEAIRILSAVSPAPMAAAALAEA